MTRLPLALLASGLVFLLGCAGSHGQIAPSVPAAPPEAPLAVAPHGNEGLLGSVHLEIDPLSGTVSVDPARMNQAIGDAFLVGLNNIDHLCPCFRVRSVSADPAPEGLRVTLNLAFDHPFTATARPDLNGWDLKAIVATDANAQSFPAAGVTASSAMVVDPDGYTSEWSDQIALAHPSLTANLFPYIVLGEDPTVSDPFDFLNPSGWNVFPAGGSNTGTLIIDLPVASSFGLDLFFTVGYQASATRTTRQTPDYQPPRGNSRSPWKIETSIIEDELTTEVGSATELEIRLWDWQHGQGLGSDVAAITLHAPALIAAPLALSPSGGSGRDTDPLFASATLTNELGTAAEGTVWALVEAIDELNANNPGGAVGNPGMTRIADDFFSPLPYDDLRTFQLVRLEVEDDDPDPTGLQLILDPIQDLVTLGLGGGPEVFNDEFGASFTQEADGSVQLLYVPSYLISTESRTSPGCRATWTGAAFAEGQISNQVPNTTVLPGATPPDWGYHLKAFTNWGGIESLYMQTWTEHLDHAPAASHALGYEIPYLNSACIAAWSNTYADFAVSPTSGVLFAFSDAITTGNPTRLLYCLTGGPGTWLAPSTMWPGGGGLSETTVDARPAAVSRWRSTGAGTGGDIHIAYRAEDSTFLAYARDDNGDNAGWATADLLTAATGGIGDPSLYRDPEDGVHIAVVSAAGTQYFLFYFESTDAGQNWTGPTPTGTGFLTEPSDLAISAATILGHDVVCIGFIESGQHWLRWSQNGGVDWEVVPLSEGPTDESADILIDRDTPTNFFSAFSAPSGGRRDVLARHGTFVEI